MKRLSSIIFAASLISLNAFGTDAFAAGFPERPIHIVVPAVPGGGTDLMARMVGASISQDLGQAVIVDNRPGAGVIVGSDFVAKSPGDGYTLLLATFGHALNPSFQAKLPYNTEKAFKPVILIGRSPNILVVRADSPYKNLGDLIAAAKANPGKLTFGSQGTGTSGHLAGELFKNMAKVDLTHVPYKGASPAMTDLLGGQISMMFSPAVNVVPYMESGKMRALGVTTGERSPSLPNIPTFAESGIPGYAAESWYGIFAPAGTPDDVIEKLNTAVRAAVQKDAFRKRVEGEGLVFSAGTPAEFGTYVQNEEIRWRKLVKENSIVPE